MDVEILDDDSLDIEILEVTNNNQSTSEKVVHVNKKEIKGNNPVEEHLISQLHCVLKEIDYTKSNIEITKSITEKTLQNLAAETAYRENSSSDSDNDLFSNTGEPIIKKRKNRHYKKRKVVEVEDTWQRVIDDKWIIGVILQNTTSCKLKKPTIYVCVKDRNDDHYGVSIFWTLAENAYWLPTEVIEPHEQFIATAAIDLPTFENENFVEVHGTIFCEFDDKMFQTPIPTVKLTVKDNVDGSCAVDMDDVDEARLSILALKAISVDRLIILPVQPESGIGRRLMNFLEKYAFREICKVCVAWNTGSLHYCVLEVLPPEDDAEVKILISAKSEAQLSVVVQLLRKDFPELLDIEKQQFVDDAAAALRKELQLYLTCTDPAQIQRARVKTDLLIP